jgi:hypothetical protein
MARSSGKGSRPLEILPSLLRPGIAADSYAGIARALDDASLEEVLGRIDAARLAEQLTKRELIALASAASNRANNLQRKEANLLVA